MFVVVYYRFSSKEQQGGYSIELQRRQVREAIARSPDYRGLEVREFLDEAKTGRTFGGRPGMEALLDFCRKHPVKAVLVYKYDRLGRNWIEAGLVIKDLEDRGIKIISGTEGDNPLVRGILIQVADYFSQQLADRTRDGLIERACDGFPCGGRTSYGFFAVPVDDPQGRKDKFGQIVKRTAWRENPKTAEYVREIWQKVHLEGLGIKNLAHQFNKRNVPPPEASKNGWDPSAIRSIARNVVYAGILVYNKRKMIRKPDGKRTYVIRPTEEWKIVKKPFIDALIDKKRYAVIIQKLLYAKPTRLRITPQPRGRYPLTGLVDCGGCGGPYAARVSKRKGHLYVYMHCAWRHRRGPKVCRNEYFFRLDEALEGLIDGLTKRLFSPENVRRVASKAEDVVKKALAARKIGKVDGAVRLKEIETSEKRLVDAIEKGGGAVDALLKRLEDLKLERQQLKVVANGQDGEKDQDQAKLKHLPQAVSKRLAEVKEVFRRRDWMQLRQELPKHIQKIVAHPQGRLEVQATLAGLLRDRPRAVLSECGSGGGI